MVSRVLFTIPEMVWLVSWVLITFPPVKLSIEPKVCIPSTDSNFFPAEATQIQYAAANFNLSGGNRKKNVISSPKWPMKILI